jgi:hypothetical protein
MRQKDVHKCERLKAHIFDHPAADLIQVNRFDFDLADAAATSPQRDAGSV